jgi:hypothetical protein
MHQDQLAADIRRSETFIRALATRHGFRARDFSMVWDNGTFQASYRVHQLAIIAADGRHSTAQIPHSALVRQDPWQYIGQVDDALMRVARRAETRGE